MNLATGQTREPPKEVGLEVVSTTGTELELRIVGRDGFTRNGQGVFLSDGRVEYSSEPALDVIEINGPPGGAETIHQEHQQMDPLLTRTLAIADENDLVVVPGSRFTTGVGKTVANRQRSIFYHRTIGVEGLSRLVGIVGTQNHTSQVEGRLLDQYRLFQALDPMWIALASTSPISDEGETRFNCSRVHLLRNTLFADPRFGAQLEEYPLSVEEIMGYGRRRHRNWAALSGISEEELESMGFDPDDTIYGTLRVKPKEALPPKGTIEQRGGDSCPLDVFLSIQALSKGVHDRIIREGLPVTVNDNYGFGSSSRSVPFYFGPEGVVLPDYTMLKRLEQSAVERGIKDPLVNMYVQEALTFAAGGLPRRDQPYLATATQMVSSRRNVADDVMDHLRMHASLYNGSAVTPEQSAAANLYLAERFKTGLEELKPLL